MNKVLIFRIFSIDGNTTWKDIKGINPTLTGLQLQPQLHILYVYISATILVSSKNSTMPENALSPNASSQETSRGTPCWKWLLVVLSSQYIALYGHSKIKRSRRIKSVVNKSMKHRGIERGKINWDFWRKKFGKIYNPQNILFKNINIVCTQVVI